MFAFNIPTGFHNTAQRMSVFHIPTGFHNTALGCGTPLPWVSDTYLSVFTPTGLRLFVSMVSCLMRRNPVGVEGIWGLRLPQIAGYRNLGLCYEIPLGYRMHALAFGYQPLKRCR